MILRLPTLCNLFIILKPPILFIETASKDRSSNHHNIYTSNEFEFQKCLLKKSKQTVLWHNQFFIYTKNTAILLQRDEPRRVCSSNTGATVLDWLVGDGELAQVMTAHLGLRRRDMLVTRYKHAHTENLACRVM